MTAPPANCRIPTSSASETASMTCSRETWYWASRPGFTWTCSIFRRSPQIGTFATPGTLSRRVRIFQ
jgi:hypothetical protein